MIQSFKCKETARIFDTGYSKKFPGTIMKSAIIKLAMLNRSKTLNELNIPPSNHLEKLHGDREGQCSIRINDKYRVCFRWKEEGLQSSYAYEVEIVDYH
ncbi:killer protein [Spirochaetia bacterium]|nr:killer protein [Spirochaetia bacterium]